MAELARGRIPKQEIVVAARELFRAGGETPQGFEVAEFDSRQQRTFGSPMPQVARFVDGKQRAIRSERDGGDVAIGVKARFAISTENGDRRFDVGGNFGNRERHA